MARIGVQIVKSVSYRGAAQPFSNTYYYEAAVALEPPTGATAIQYCNDLLDDVIPLERARHSTAVTFVMARAWSQLGSQAQNQMIVQRSLSGTGSDTNVSNILDRERAFLIRLRAGVDTRGRPVYLRKWFHLDVNTVGSTPISNAMLQQTAQLPQAARDNLATFMDQFKVLTPGAGPNATLVAKNGRPIDGATVAHPYLEHRQLGDAWRGV